MQLGHLRPLTSPYLDTHEYMAFASLPDLEKVGQGARELLQL
jgi:hypothetical protein